MLRIQASFLAAILVCTNYLPKAFQSLFWVASALIAQTTHKQSVHSLGLWVAPVSPKGLSYLLLDNLCATELNLHPSLTIESRFTVQVDTGMIKISITERRTLLSEFSCDNLWVIYTSLKSSFPLFPWGPTLECCDLHLKLCLLHFLNAY